MPFTLNPCGRCISGSFALVFDACCRQFHAQKTLRFARCMRVYISFLSSQSMLRYSHWKLNVYCDIMNTNAFSQTFAKKTHFVYFHAIFAALLPYFSAFFFSLSLFLLCLLLRCCCCSRCWVVVYYDFFCCFLSLFTRLPYENYAMHAFA